MDTLFSEYPAYRAEEGTERLLYNGNPMAPSEIRNTDGTRTEKGTIRLYDMHGQFMGIYAYDEKIRRFRPVKLFYAREEETCG